MLNGSLRAVDKYKAALDLWAKMKGRLTKLLRTEVFFLNNFRLFYTDLIEANENEGISPFALIKVATNFMDSIKTTKMVCGTG